MDIFPITQEGYDNLLKEYEHLTKNELPAIITKVAEARSLGDLKENAEYHAAREYQSLLQSRIHDLRDKIAKSHIIKLDSAKSNCIMFGSTVQIQDIEDGIIEEYTLVGEAEANASVGKLSTASPMGKGLIGKPKGDEIKINTPNGVLQFKIINFSN